MLFEVSNQETFGKSQDRFFEYTSVDIRENTGGLISGKGLNFIFLWPI